MAPIQYILESLVGLYISVFVMDMFHQQYTILQSEILHNGAYKFKNIGCIPIMVFCQQHCEHCVAMWRWGLVDSFD